MRRKSRPLCSHAFSEDRGHSLPAARGRWSWFGHILGANWGPRGVAGTLRHIGKFPRRSDRLGASAQGRSFCYDSACGSGMHAAREERLERMRRGFGNRWLWTTLAAGVALLTAASGARAQDRWWEAIPGFGQPDQRYRTSNEEARRKPEALNDLRPDATPFRSDAMIEALEAAVARYQSIVASGGWPAIPGSRMIRVEDDDERLP